MRAGGGTAFANCSASDARPEPASTPRGDGVSAEPMTDAPLMPALRARLPDPWSVLALAIAGLVLLPIAAVTALALSPEGLAAWPHLSRTVLPRYLLNTGVLMAAVGMGSAVVGVGCAWLVTFHRFPGSRALRWLLLLPLAIPAYVGAYALTDFLEYAGPVQTGLRALFGWESARDYAFPEIRSRGGAIVVLTAALYPYVFLMARAAFREQSGHVYEVARALGVGPWGLMRRVGLPLARPAVAAGVAIVMMETAADFGAVDHFAVQTLTTGIFSAWLEGGNRASAAQIAVLILLVVLALAGLERAGRRQARVHTGERGLRPYEPRRLRGRAAAAAAAACWTPFALGFALPVGVMVSHALGSLEPWQAPGLASAALGTVTVSGAAALVTVAAAVALTYAARTTAAALPRRVLPLTMLGYAAPGAVLGLGILIPLAALDHAVADAVVALGGPDPGLILTGGIAALVYAYAVRFFAVAQGAADSAMGRVAPSLPMAARSLGRGPVGTLRAVHLPIMRGSVLSALLLVFVDCVKELPATLLLRPFGYETLATRVYEQASLERIDTGSSAALLVIGVGLAAVLLLARTAR